MIIAGLQKLTLLDYPGKLAATVFTYGCTLRCPFCHNPELVTCPLQNVNRYDTEEIYDFMRSRAGKLQALAITGGEPSLHQDLVPFMQTVKDMGFLIKLDTYGLNPERVQEIMDTRIVDYWAMDVKGDLDVYRKCGYKLDDMNAINSSIEIIATQAPEYEFRTTVVKGASWHTPEVFEDIAKRISGAQNYYIQNFRAGKNISSSFSTSNSFNHAELADIETMFKDQVVHVSVRN